MGVVPRRGGAARAASAVLACAAGVLGAVLVRGDEASDLRARWAALQAADAASLAPKHAREVEASLKTLEQARAVIERVIKDIGRAGLHLAETILHNAQGGAAHWRPLP